MFCRFWGQVGGGDRAEKRRGGENREVVRQEQRSVTAHRQRLSAIVSHRLPGPPGRAVHEQHQSHNHHIRGERDRQQLVHARQTVSTDIRLPSAEKLAPSVHDEERGDRVQMPRDRADRQRRGFCHGTRLPWQVRRGTGCLPAGCRYPLSEKAFVSRQTIFDAIISTRTGSSSNRYTVEYSLKYVRTGMCVPRRSSENFRLARRKRRFPPLLFFEISILEVFIQRSAVDFHAIA